MNAQTVVYGNPNDIAIFEQKSSTNDKILSKESYADDLLKVYEKSFSGITEDVIWEHKVGDIVTGIVSNINETELLLDTGGKEMIYVSFDKERSEPADYTIGQELTVLVMEDTNYIKGSMSEFFKKSLYEELKTPNNNSFYEATVLYLTDNGYTLDIEGLKVFMPGSLGGVNKLLDFNTLVGETITVKPIKNDNRYSRYRDQLIVSHRDYLQTLIPNEVSRLVIGDVYSGKVTDTTKFGVFCEFNGVLTGLIHEDDFDEELRRAYDAKELIPGREVDFYLREVVSNRRIILSRTPVDLEEQSKPKFKKGEVVNGKVVKTMNYGSFISLGRNTSGLIHSSKLDGKVLEEKTKIKVKILDNKNNKYDLGLA